MVPTLLREEDILVAAIRLLLESVYLNPPTETDKFQVLQKKCRSANKATKYDFSYEFMMLDWHCLINSTWDSFINENDQNWSVCSLYSKIKSYLISLALILFMRGEDHRVQFDERNTANLRQAFWPGQGFRSLIARICAADGCLLQNGKLDQSALLHWACHSGGSLSFRQKKLLREIICMSNCSYGWTLNKFTAGAAITLLFRTVQWPAAV